MSKNNKKYETLGMPHGTAANRLRKSLLYKYVVLAGDNFCFKCGAEIESVSDLSIEHKEPWEGVSSDLFFDLENISFSHAKCNTKDRLSNGMLRRDIPKNKKWCYQCKCVKDISSFWKDRSTSDGYKNNCVECHSKARRQRKLRGRS